jgi:putative transferase (TIGR04331 family)
LVPKVLITTAIEETWPLNKDPVIFLGEWCLRYDRKETWRNIDYKVADYHWDDREKLYTDYQYINELHELLLSDMHKYLNTLHQTDHTLRYWRIQLGPWMNYFLPILFDRWTMLNNVTKDYDISFMYSLTYQLENFIARDSSQFFDFSSSDSWNQMIFAELGSHMGIKQQGRGNQSTIDAGEKNKSKGGFKKTLKKSLRGLVNYLAFWLQAKDDVFVMTPYLSLTQSAKLHLKLGQFPTLWKSPELDFENQINPTIRLKLGQQDSNFRKIAFSMLKRHVPIIFLEAYKASVANTYKLPWPQSPSSIITAQSHVGHDLFKLWAGDKIEKGTALITIQHGGSYGAALWNAGEEHQIKISDQYLSWGWKDDSNKKVVPFCNVKCIKTNLEHSKNGGLLLVGLTLPIFSYTMLSGTVAIGQWKQHFNDQINFLAGLPKHIIDKTTLRLEEIEYGNCQSEMWNDQLVKYPISIESTNDCSIYKSWRCCRLSVSTYNATTFLETMSLGIPTLIFWNPKHWELRESAVPYFELLQNVGIFHTTPENAAQHLTEIWDDVDGWWCSEPVISARNRFCNEYSRGIDKPLNLLARLSKRPKVV